MKPLNVSGKRRKAIARAVIKEGTGQIMVNSKPLETCEPRIARQKIEEPLIIAGERAKNADINIAVKGGGVMGQAEAARLVIARALVAFTKDKKLEKEFLDYDRQLLVADVRQRETRKPNTAGKARAKVQKSYR